MLAQEQILAFGKVFKLYSISLLLMIFTAIGLGFWFCHQALPTLDGIVTIADLDRPARVRFDQLAIPYIQASSQTDLYLAQGYITASERMFQMDIMRRLAEGELAEIFGGSCLTQDKLMRTIGFSRLAKQELSELSPEAIAHLKAYCRGVNIYLNQSINRLPVEFLMIGYRPRLWQPQDTLCLLKFLQYELDESWRLDEFRDRMIARGGVKLASRMFERNFADRQLKTSLIPGLNCKDFLKRYPDFANPSLGSNAWAIGKDLSSSHSSLLASDKHCLCTSPDLFYACSLQGPAFHAAGATIPGVPGIILGRNDNIAWTMASLKSDGQDLFVEQFSDKYPSKYRIEDGWSNALEITEEIPQRFSSSVLEKIVQTRHGPVLLRNETMGIALSWSGFHTHGSILETIEQLNKTTDWTGFRKVLKTYDGSPQVFVYADCQGNIGMQTAGAIPIRKCDRKLSNQFISNGDTVLCGWSNNCAWTDYFKFEELPYSFNPADSFIVANDPRSSMLSTNANTRATERILTVLSHYKKTAEHPDLPDMSALQGDMQASLAALVREEIQHALTHTQSIDRYQQEAIHSLDKWNGQLRPDSQAACIYESFLLTFLRRVLEPRIGLESANEYIQRWPKWSSFIGTILREKPQDFLPANQPNWDTFILTTLTESLKNLKLALGSEPSSWLWKNLHRINYEELSKRFSIPTPLTILLAPQTFGVGGDQDCVNAYNVTSGKNLWTFAATSGPTERVIIDLSDPDKFYQSLTLGQSGHLLSDYRFDQIKSWSNAEPHSLAFSEKQIQQQMQHSLILTNKYQ